MARGTLAQQVGQVVSMAAGLAATTVLARDLSLAEFGAYGLVVSFSTYLYFALGSAETAALAALSAAVDQRKRTELFTATVGVYALIGTLSGIVVAVVGVLVMPLLVDGNLVDDAQLGAIGVGVSVALGWPAKASTVLIRADHRFGLAAFCEGFGTVALSATLVALVVADAPLWLLVTIGSGLSLYVGAVGTIAIVAVGLANCFRPREFHRATGRELLGMSGSLLAISASDVVINQLDRTIVAIFRSTAVVGLYEGATRINGVVRTLAGSFGVTVLPVLGRLSATGEIARERELIVRGTKYVLALVVPVTLSLMVYADVVLEFWLGDEFGAAGTATVIFLGWWLLAPNLVFANSILTVDRAFRSLAIYAWGVALLNLVLSVSLTAALGLEGVAIGTTGAFAIAMPFYLSYVARRRGLSLGVFARRVWIAVYGLAAILAAGLLAARFVFSVDSGPAVAGLLVAGPLLYWAAFYFLFLDREERALLRVITGSRPSQAPSEDDQAG